MFWHEVFGPEDIGATMCAFVTVLDATGREFNPPNVVIRARKWQGGDKWLTIAYLKPGDKDLGKCELAPLVDGQARYDLQAVCWLTGASLSEPALLDLSLPFVPADPAVRAALLSRPGRFRAWWVRLMGQYHKSFRVYFHQGEPPPPPTPPTHIGWSSGPFCLGQEFTAFFQANDVPPGCVVVGEKCNAGDDAWYPLDVSRPLNENGRTSYTPLLGEGDRGARFRWRVVDAAGAVVSSWAYCDTDAPWARDGDVGGPCRAGVIPPNNFRRRRASFKFAFVRAGAGE